MRFRLNTRNVETGERSVSYFTMSQRDFEFVENYRTRHGEREASVMARKIVKIAAAAKLESALTIVGNPLELASDDAT